MPDISLETLLPFRDVPFTLTAELGHRVISGKQLMDLQPGSVLELPTPAGENVGLLVEDVVLGTGEVLVMNNSLGVRVSELKDKTPELVHDSKAGIE